MAVRVLFYCMVLFAGMMVFLIVKEPYRIKEVGVDGRLVPDIELFNARNYQIKEPLQPRVYKLVAVRVLFYCMVLFAGMMVDL